MSEAGLSVNFKKRKVENQQQQPRAAHNFTGFSTTVTVVVAPSPAVPLADGDDDGRVLSADTAGDAIAECTDGRQTGL